jgi:hypothetical protein
MNNIVKFAVVVVAIAAVGCAAFWFLSTEYDVTFPEEDAWGSYAIAIDKVDPFKDKVSVMKGNSLKFTVIVDIGTTNLKVFVNGDPLPTPDPIGEDENEYVYTLSKINGKKEVTISYGPI